MAIPITHVYLTTEGNAHLHTSPFLCKPELQVTETQLRLTFAQEKHVGNVAEY